MRQTVIIVAGGSGNRMESQLPKQFIKIDGFPILMHTIKRFYEYNPQIDIRLVLPEKHFCLWKELKEKYSFIIPHSIFAGGSSRFQSVKNGLQNIKNNTLIAIHDGVRPFVTKEVIYKGYKTAEENGAAIPVIEVLETIRKIEDKHSVTVDRSLFRLVQTPQIFKSDILIPAYEQNYQDKFTDDASVVEEYGISITMFNGNRENIKITTPNDLIIAKAYCEKFAN